MYGPASFNIMEKPKSALERFLRIFGLGPKPKQQYNVGKSIATFITRNGEILTNTVIGSVHFDVFNYVYRSDLRLNHRMEDVWIQGDDGTYYNRSFIDTYTVVTEDYIIEQ